MTKGIQLGLQYRFRFSVSNINGQSDYSEHSYIFALSPPSTPPQPIFVSATNSEVTLGFQPSKNDYGTKISNYKLFIDQEGDGASTFTQITAYSTFASQFTLTALNSNIGPAGKTYRVRI